jgi:hypothetical protein
MGAGLPWAAARKVAVVTADGHHLISRIKVRVPGKVNLFLAIRGVRA